ncbi:SgcJ/EcaC family oxidoreductase [Kutzneria sp. CA-103260]|uniref:SgcJ/EcaC family oxidoreductase n=1 Tax=Kutzneria sp. CA-103260 TaxID=2802641 RepID=UPI001BACB4ED|nr:SgcJ/EcaC family oxidoreductase [Kutzneria sp. CA-103260]QUQ63431.1 SgcJ/EcaC family oxidoreductase [Kutzneria sp. CA-103260]
MSDEIKALWARMTEGWAAGSGERFAAVFAADTDFVNVRGEEQHGREMVAKGHQMLFESRFRDTTLTAETPTIRFINDNAAVVHVVTTVDGVDGLLVRTHAQAVVERRDGEWLITAFHNMVPAGPR